jgi:hypothetical protein
MDQSKGRKPDDVSLTPDQCKKVAESFSDLPKEFQLSAEELEIIAEEVEAKPLKYGTAEDAIEAMQSRLALLKGQKGKTLFALDNCKDELQRKILTEDLHTLAKDIAAAEMRLGSYRFQQEREN